MKLTVGVVFESFDSSLRAAAWERLEAFTARLDRDMHAAIGIKFTSYYRLRCSEHPAGLGMTHYLIILERQPWTEFPAQAAVWLDLYRHSTGSAPMSPRFRGAVVLVGGRA